MKRWVAAGMSLALSVLSAVLLMPNAARAAPGDLQAVIADGDGTVLHGMRGRDRRWTPFAAPAPWGANRAHRDMATVTIGGELQVVTINHAGRAFHGIRRANGTWSAPLTDVKDAVPRGNDAGTLHRVAVAHANGELHLAVLGSTGLYHAVRHANGTWSAFTDVKRTTAGDPGYVTDVTIAGDGPDLHLAVSTIDNGLFHARRLEAARWTRFEDVQRRTGNPKDHQFQQLSGSVAAGRFHLLARSGTQGLRYTARRADGGWEQMISLPTVAGTIPGGQWGYLSIATAETGGTLHVAAVLASLPLGSADAMYHAVCAPADRCGSRASWPVPFTRVPAGRRPVLAAIG
ncbi:hypothetical protein [Catenuloplanes atrovinosus]|uniref:Uncharacterized protein n=1 Tax=Catenuloplanes atrovinosus TaxID=137266 RepID=A0AAE4C9Z2_9ACTN|nr:hypothetical protein [Catenuloplanes atrovinosus]MDR7276342.1 hypothetical protein [Catenuloplanes atrovinosus]